MRFVVLGAVLTAALITSGFRSSPPTQQLLVWTQSPHGNIDEIGSLGMARTDGTIVNPRFLEGARSPAGVAVADGYIYWANYTTGTISRARLDGTDINGKFLHTEIYSVVGIATDSQHIFWSYQDVFAGTGWIARANLDGSHVDPRFIRTGDSPGPIAVHDGTIYWTHRNFRFKGFGTVFSYAIGRAFLDGSEVDRNLIRVPTAVDGVAANDRFVFWSNVGEHVIGRAALDGRDVYQRCINAQVAPLQNVPEGLAVDNAHVYWTNYPADSISRANLDGTGLSVRFIHLHGVPEGITIVGSRARDANVGACTYVPQPILFGPTTQAWGPYAEGWGEVAPAVISNGGAAASGTIFDIRWKSWGGAVAVGRGLHPTYAPQGGYYRLPVAIEIRASRVRRCVAQGVRVYTSFVFREQIHPGGRFGNWTAWASNMCRSR